MIGLRCPYCHNNKAREDKFHAGTCENCGGILEAEGGYLNAKPYSPRSYITQEQLDDCIVPYSPLGMPVDEVDMGVSVDSIIIGESFYSDGSTRLCCVESLELQCDHIAKWDGAIWRAIERAANEPKMD